MRVSTETIYKAVYLHVRGELRRELGKAAAARSYRSKVAKTARRPASTVRLLSPNALSTRASTRRSEPLAPATTNALAEAINRLHKIE
jgi:hypothetical protein